MTRRQWEGAGILIGGVMLIGLTVLALLWSLVTIYVEQEKSVCRTYGETTHRKVEFKEYYGSTTCYVHTPTGVFTREQIRN